MIKTMIAFVFAITVAGCSILPDSGTTESLAVNYLFSKATTAVIDQGAVTPNQVIDAVEDARQYIETGETVTVGRLYDAAIERISGLDPADRILVTAILDNARARLETAIDAGELDESERVALLDALNWIEMSAQAEL